MRRRLASLCCLLLAVVAAKPAALADARPIRPQSADEILASLSPEERVGQLFLVAFPGADTGPDSEIYDLIVNYHVGGVVLARPNDNFVAAPDTVVSAHDLIARLQRLEYDAANPTAPVEGAGAAIENSYVPLLVGIAQGGNGFPDDQILAGLTPLPSLMALGASWDPELAREIGTIQGRELDALGFNFLLGPSLDVVDAPNPQASGDLGSNVFGGDPFWVGTMAQDYIRGLHDGGRGGLLVVAKHFPGRGGSDRKSEDEVSTVRKSLEQLKQIELAPFFAVTSAAPGDAAAADGLLVSHIRYQGLQGNIRATTRPVSFDPQALQAIMSLPQLEPWRSGGGLMVSDDLGTRAVRDFYTAGGSTFSPRTTVREAFLAGNDLLLVGNIASGTEEVDSQATIVDVLEFFAQKYREDAAFAGRVDESALRVLNAKLRLYPGFSIRSVIPEAGGLDAVGTGIDLTFRVAQRAAAVISPARRELVTVLPAAPQVRERLVFITDTALAAQCSICLPMETPELAAFERAVLRLYGPTGDSQTSTFLVSSYSLDALTAMLDQEQPPYLEADIDRANWIVFSIAGAERGQAQVVSRFLRERQDLLPRRNIVVFAFGAPYYFDATDISHMTAYFALFSKQEPFFDVAARILFQELTPTGNSPVSISAVGYDLISVMTPDPAQIIRLALDLKPTGVAAEAPATAQPTAIPLFRIGDTISVRTGTISDHNGRPVPDGTVVRFTMVLTGEGGGIVQQVDSVTSQGVARASFGLDKPGLLEISAKSEPAVVSEVLQLDVSQTGSVAVTVVVPEFTLQPGALTSAAPNVPQETGAAQAPSRPGISAWFLSMVLLGMSGLAGFWLGDRLESRRTGMQWALGISLGGLIAYDYMVLGMPGASAWLAGSGVAGMVGLVLVGGLAGLGVMAVWSRRR